MIIATNLMGCYNHQIWADKMTKNPNRTSAVTLWVTALVRFGYKTRISANSERTTFKNSNILSFQTSTRNQDVSRIADRITASSRLSIVISDFC